MKGLESTRWKIVWLLVLISVVRSMDAVNFSVAAKQIMPEYGVTEVQVGLLYSIYLLGYAAFHLPGGLLADVLGPRKLLGAALVWWSVFTGLTAIAPQLPGLSMLGPFAAFLVVRFFIGLAEGACYPGSTRMLASWMAPDERASAGGLVLGGMGIGYAITPPIVAFLMVQYGWRVAFCVFALIGIGLAVRWYTYTTDVPETHPHVSSEELQRIRSQNPRLESAEHTAVPWRSLLTNTNVWLLGAAGFCLGYGVFLYQAWFYLYLVNVRGFSELGGGVFATGPFIAVALLSPLGGKLSDALVRGYGQTKGRRVGAIFGLVLSAVCTGIGAGVEHPYVAIVLLSLGDGFLYMSGASAFATIIDIGGPYTGVTYGFANLMTILGGVLAPTLTPLLANRFGWEGAIYAMMFLTLIGAVIWLKIDAGKPLVVNEPTPTLQATPSHP
jgi:MFS transporter, ACS family, glucarate transporter